MRAFEVGDVAVTWMGGLTGTQARNRPEGSQAFAQRDIAPDFHSLFIATEDSGLEEIPDASGLTSLRSRRSECRADWRDWRRRRRRVPSTW